jgi:hypothetical protein
LRRLGWSNGTLAATILKLSILLVPFSFVSGCGTKATTVCIVRINSLRYALSRTFDVFRFHPLPLRFRAHLSTVVQPLAEEETVTSSALAIRNGVWSQQSATRATAWRR